MGTKAKKFDLLVAGEINPDLILSKPGLTPEFGQTELLVDNEELVIGSSSSIHACGAARLGLKVAIIGVVGDDAFGQFMLNALESRGVDTSFVIVDKNIKTGLSVILSRGEDRAILTYLGGIAALRADQVTDEMLETSRHLHIGHYFLQDALRPGLAGLFERAKQKGLSISLDTNWDPEEKWEGVKELMPYLDIFYPNENELLSLTGKQTIDEGIRSLKQRPKHVAVKMGSEGAAVYFDDQVLRADSIKIDPIADTVGAGDSFDAGFTYGYLNGWDLQKALRLGVVCGALSLREHGGTASQPTLDEAMQFM
jgi:sugar/nucleoside kinase (ribokinase family)